MPIYEYVCDECGERFEVFQRNRNTPESPHAACGGTGRRVMSQTSFALKGSGWYRDHYGLKPGGSEAASGTGSSGSGTSGGASGGGSSDSGTSPSAGSGSSSDKAGTSGTGGGATQKSGGTSGSGSSSSASSGKKSAA